MVKNRKLFFEKIKLDENGNVIVVLNNRVLPTSKAQSQYNAFKTLSFDSNNNLKISK